MLKSNAIDVVGAAAGVVDISNISKSKGDEECKISYVTDIEGNLDYFKRFVKLSEVLTLKDGTLEFIDNSSKFVFGGDLFDKGPGDIRLAKLMVDFKHRYPDRVFLLIGNRDANKLRLFAELSEAEVRDRDVTTMPSMPVVQCSITPLEHLRKAGLTAADNSGVTRLKWMLEATLGCKNTFEFRRQELAELSQIDPGRVTDEQVLQSFVDSVTPGHKDAFVLRYLHCAQVAVVIEDTLFVHGGISDVSINFVPDPLHLRYYDRATGIRVVHSPFEVPGRQLPGHATPQDWVSQLNEAAKTSLKHFETQPLWYQDAKGIWRRGGESLMAMQSNPATQRRGVVVHSMVKGSAASESVVTPVYDDTGTRSGDVRNMSRRLIEYLASGGIHRVVVGHKPTGDSPLIGRFQYPLHNAETNSDSKQPRAPSSSAATGDDGNSTSPDSGKSTPQLTVEVISADNSFGGGRGRSSVAVTEVLILADAGDGADCSDPTAAVCAAPLQKHAKAESDSDSTRDKSVAGCTRLRVRGTLHDGREYDFALPSPSASGSCVGVGTLVGMKLKDGAWVKARLPDNKFLTSLAEGRKLTYNILTEKELISKI